jgi:hypothetical protein
MNSTKSGLIFLAVSLGLLLMLGAALAVPVETHAHPVYGFTPEPPPRPTPDDNDSDKTPPPPRNEVPTDYVWVQIEECDFECLEAFAEAGNIWGDTLLAYADTGENSSPLSLFDNATALATVPELVVPVQMVHQGSGWIAVGELSTYHPSQMPVPYTGEWEVFLTGPPRLITADAVDLSPTNIEEFQAASPNAPIFLAQVETNTNGPQMIKCPVVCVIEAQPVEEPPPFLPVTGGSSFLTQWVGLVALALILIGVGLLILHTISVENREAGN